MITPLSGQLTPIGSARRKATFTPASIAGLLLWLRADVGAYQDLAKTTLCTNGTTVAAWADQSGNGNDATQSGSSFRPTFTTGELNGLPGIIFSPTVETSLATSAFTLSQPCTVAFLAKTLDATNTNQYYCDGTSVNTRVVHLFPSDTSLDLFAGSANSGATTAAQTSFFAAINVFNGSSSLINFMGTETTGLSPGTGNGTGMTVGSGGGRTSPLNGPIVEMVAYNSALTSAQRTSLMTYLRGRGGI